MKSKGKSRGKIEEELSEERTLLSNERTLLSYVRTAFAIIVAGIAIIGFFRSGTLAIIGMIIVVIGVLFFVIGVLYYLSRKKKIKEEATEFED
jgi:putative membrane protein